MPAHRDLPTKSENSAVISVMLYGVPTGILLAELGGSNRQITCEA